MAKRTYHIIWNVMTKEPAGGVPVTAEIPDAWTAEVDPTGSPSFAVPGLGGFTRPAITAVPATGADDAARIEAVAKLQFGDDLAAARREPRAGGRSWIVSTRASGHVHARMLVPAAAPGVVVASVLLAPAEASRLAEIERVFETVRVTAS
jgi:hypothetical protein